MILKDAYHYLFYKFYKLFANGPASWLGDWKAELIIDVLLFFVIFSGIIYYTIYFNPYLNLGDRKYIVLFFVLTICVPNYLIFHHQDQWKGIVKKFDKLPRRKHIIGGVIVYSIVVLVIVNLIVAFYLMSQIDWKQYR